MIYRSFGQTGKDVSAIGFGGMRFPKPEDIDNSAELLHHAFDNGINYFDTAPVYCGDRSEDIFGHGLSTLPRDQFFISTKCSRSKGSDLRKSLERSLERMKTGYIDFLYIWHLMSADDWQQRQTQGAIEAALQAKEEGLIKHLFCSSHMQGDSLSQVLDENIFEGVLLGYNALNFTYRRKAVDHAGQLGLGVVTMNPLSGGLIPRNAERFSFIKTRPQQTVVQAALNFNLSHPSITTTLVGFATIAQIDEAISAVNQFTPLSEEEQLQLSPNIDAGFDALCTGCGYCLPCPVDIPVPQFMDTYNQVILTNNEKNIATNRLRLQWGLKAEQAQSCIECRACEERCTQHLPIIERLKELAGSSD